MHSSCQSSRHRYVVLLIKMHSLKLGPYHQSVAFFCSLKYAEITTSDSSCHKHVYMLLLPCSYAFVSSLYNWEQVKPPSECILKEVLKIVLCHAPDHIASHRAFSAQSAHPTTSPTQHHIGPSVLSQSILPPHPHSITQGLQCSVSHHPTSSPIILLRGNTLTLSTSHFPVEWPNVSTDSSVSGIGLRVNFVR